MLKNITLNFQRLHEAEYSLGKLFQPADYDWPGDWEGRALLAFLCHYEIHKGEVPHLNAFFQAISKHVNEDFYFGEPFDGVTVDEQQLSGHNWYLRGLLKYAENFHSETAMQYARSTVENLYLPAVDWYGKYPLERNTTLGEVSGSLTGVQNGWRLSSDIGCAFMCVDGLAHYYAATGDERVKSFLDRVIEFFVTVDLMKYKLQTHTTLTCLRGVLRLYETTKEEKYLQIVKEKFAFYVQHGMTLTYENFNWFGREDTWTEPCAVVDSLILATELYKRTGESAYKTLARRIWFNGLQFCQRSNGGAGPNTCVTETQPILKISMYEAPFCCTMRYAEGLLAYAKNQALFDWNSEAETITDELGRKFVDDKLLIRCEGEEQVLFSCNTLSQEQANALKLTVL